MDLVIEPDGSSLAARIAVYDTDITSLSLAFGPPTVIYPSGAYQAVYPVMDPLEVEQDGQLMSLIGLYSLNEATPQSSGQLANLQSLPFKATFDSAEYGGWSKHLDQHTCTTATLRMDCAQVNDGVAE
jgi:hypothetical protein